MIFASGELNRRAGKSALGVFIYYALTFQDHVASDSFAFTPTVIQNEQYVHTLPKGVGPLFPNPESPALTLFRVRIS